MGGIIYGQAQSCNLILKGHVQDIDSREKLLAATVSILETGKTIVTDAMGDFEFHGLCAGNYTVTVSHVDCGTVAQKISLDKNRHMDISLPHLKNTLSEVTLSSRKNTLNTGFKKELSMREMEETKGQTLAEVLGKMNGVSILQTGSTIAKPIIHGLHSNRILTINNGVRQEGQQWGNEHAPEIDPFVAGKLEVIKGVDELKYGSDAIGGVILVEPKALPSKPGLNAELNTAYFTNNRQYVVSGMLDQQLTKLPSFSYRVQGTYKKGANATTPHYRLNNTGSEEKNFSLAALWKKHQLSSELFYSFFDTQVGIFEGSHIGNIPDLESAIASENPDPVYLGENTYTIKRPYQDVQHHLLKSKSVFQNGHHKLGFLFATQFNYRKEFDIIRNSNSNVPQSDLAIASYSEELSWEFNDNKAWSHQAGVIALQQQNEYAGRYFIPAYKANNIGGYYISKWHDQKWDLDAGLRYDNKNILSHRLGGDGIRFEEHKFNFNTIGASFNTGYKINNLWKVNATLSRASRAPQVNELLSNGIHHGTATFEQGDSNLLPEKALNFSLNNSWTSKNKKVNIEATLYRNQVNQFIYQQPKPDQPVLTIAGAFPLLVYQQNNVVLQGIDFSTHVEIAKPLTWDFKYAMLRARNTDADDWLIRMPADKIENELSYNFKESKKLTSSFVSFSVSNIFKQTRVPSDKNGRQDYKEAPGAYTLLNVDAGTTLLNKKFPLTISLGIRNAFNTVYRNYLNSLRYFTDETGRSFQLRLTLPIKNI